MKTYISLFFLSIFLISCSNSEGTPEELIDYDALNETEIQNYISDNNLTPQKSNSGLYYIILNEGTGNSPSLSSNVKIYYKGYTTDGTVFDESPVNGVDFDLDQLIKGFSEGVTYLKEGGEATLIIPSKLAYLGNTTHPLSGRVLVFDIKLISIN